MGKIAEHICEKIIPEAPDRHANRLAIYKSIGGQYRINFRNLQIRLSKAEFEMWRTGFNKAKAKLGDLMQHDEIKPLDTKE